MARLEDFDPGQMRQRVTIQQSVQGAQNTRTGQPSITWSNLATNEPCSVIPLSGSEFWSSQAHNLELTHTVIMRYRSDLNGTMRLLFGARVLSVEGPPQNWMELSQWMVLRCKEGVTNE